MCLIFWSTLKLSPLLCVCVCALLVVYNDMSLHVLNLHVSVKTFIFIVCVCVRAHIFACVLNYPFFWEEIFKMNTHTVYVIAEAS